jgi:hypothetical protein
VVAQFVSDLHLPLSQTRLETYRPLGGSDLDMLTNYFWNIDLAEALVPSLHAAELALRNSIHAAPTNLNGMDMWFYQPGLFETSQLGEFARALLNVSKKGTPTSGRLVASLMFGFWVSMLNSPYEQRLWATIHYALLHTVFPNAPGSRKEISDRFVMIKDLRNRVMHYEPIWNDTQLFTKHYEIHDAIRWISPTLHRSVHAVDNFPTIFNGRAQVEAGLKQHLGIP